VDFEPSPPWRFTARGRSVRGKRDREEGRASVRNSFWETSVV